jgi:hypothetical protein
VRESYFQRLSGVEEDIGQVDMMFIGAQITLDDRVDALTIRVAKVEARAIAAEAREAVTEERAVAAEARVVDFKLMIVEMAEDK